MSKAGETFFVAIGCMDGRVQKPIAKLGLKEFNALFADTITEAGLVGHLAKDLIDESLTKSISFKMIDVSIGKHNAQGIIVHGHQECAGNPVSDEEHIDHIRKASKKIKLMVKNIPVVGAFVFRSKKGWDAKIV